MLRGRDIDPDTWTAVDRAVLCFIRDPLSDEILLIHKKTGLGAGLINAPGGRIEPGESPGEAAVRETLEEVGVRVDNPRHAGDLFFQFVDGYSIRGYVFISESWSGQARETDEADPFWCRTDAVPFDRMWVDDAWWLPHLLAGRPFRGRFLFDGETMLSMSLDVESTDSSGIPRPPRWRRET